MRRLERLWLPGLWHWQAPRGKSKRDGRRGSPSRVARSTSGRLRTKAVRGLRGARHMPDELARPALLAIARTLPRRSSADSLPSAPALKAQHIAAQSRHTAGLACRAECHSAISSMRRHLSRTFCSTENLCGALLVGVDGFSPIAW